MRLFLYFHGFMLISSLQIPGMQVQRLDSFVADICNKWRLLKILLHPEYLWLCFDEIFLRFSVRPLLATAWLTDISEAFRPSLT